MVLTRMSRAADRRRGYIVAAWVARRLCLSLVASPVQEFKSRCVKGAERRR